MRASWGVGRGEGRGRVRAMTFFPRPGKRVAGVRGGVAPAMSAQPVLGRAMRFGRPSRKKSAQDFFPVSKFFMKRVSGSFH